MRILNPDDEDYVGWHADGEHDVIVTSDYMENCDYGVSIKEHVGIAKTISNNGHRVIRIGMNAENSKFSVNWFEINEENVEDFITIIRYVNSLEV